MTPNWSASTAEKALEHRPGHYPYISSTGKTYYLPGSPRMATWQEAEASAQQWMRTHGYPDARLTSPGPDGGVDIFSSTAIAQVKHHKQPIGPGPIRELVDLTLYSKYRGWGAVFFSTSGYTALALECGQEWGVPLFQRDHLHQTWVRVA
ncbi:restriction endonuclease [Kocuria sp. CPCC 205263]|uniref:restriction endonuclease n=1 Tax=Kocuria sp. CPCC 205263 TaxID=3073555 RepID=UPI0034D52033